MIERVVLDGAPDADGLAHRLRTLGNPPAVEDSGGGPGTLWVTGNAERARNKLSQGIRAWTVGATGELQHWDDLPLAVALADGTLADVRGIVQERLEPDGLRLKKLEWTPDGAASGGAEKDGRSVPILVTAGPDGENPQILVGGEAETMARERGTFIRTLAANDQIASDGSKLEPSQTHALDASDSRRPRVVRRRFSLYGEDA